MTFHINFESVSVQRMGEVVEEPQPIDDMYFINKQCITIYKWVSTETVTGGNPTHRYSTTDYTKPRCWFMSVSFGFRLHG